MCYFPFGFSFVVRSKRKAMVKTKNFCLGGNRETQQKPFSSETLKDKGNKGTLLLFDNVFVHDAQGATSCSITMLIIGILCIDLIDQSVADWICHWLAMTGITHSSCQAAKSD